MYEDDSNMISPRRYTTPGRAPEGMPTWPEADMRPQRSIVLGSARPATLAAVLAVSLGANVALIVALLAVVLLARAGYIAPSARPGVGVSSVSSATSSPAPSPSVTTGTTSGWLQVTPTSIQLGCDSGQQTQFVVLANTGSDSVHWQIDLGVPSDQAGISVFPRRGTIRPGTSVTLQIQNRSNGDGTQGVISFTTDTPAAGSSPSISYTAMGC